MSSHPFTAAATTAATAVPATSGPPRRSLIGRILGGVAALLATFVVLLTALVMLGSYIPAIPKVGVIGPVLGGQYPFHMALFAVMGSALALLAWRLGLVRWGRTVTVTGVLSLAGALVIAGVQYVDAEAVGTDVSFSEVFTQIAYPGTKPDTTQTYATHDGEALQVDAYLPDGADARDDGDAAGRGGGKVPAIVLAHAGGFHVFDKSDLRGTGRWLADHNVAAFAIDYRLATPERATWDKAPYDLVDALRWVQDHADEYGIDPDRISMGGMSAGGVLALNTSYRLQNGTIEAINGRTPEAPASVVGFYPGTDVNEMWERNIDGSRNAAELFTGGTPEQYPDRYREVSPTSDIRPGLQPTLLVVGDRDRGTTPTDVRRFGNALRAEGVDTKVKELPFAVHAFDDAYGSLSSQASRQILLDFLTAGTS
ncbi:alpha/beta hydrolase [Streptomyces sp. NPDC088387]|uniref:alpha/beta hydrolase n=1 Tax=Streptomyces sp. NPDC088387 TaxID=3365859 RepID=UPI0038241D04